MKPMGASPEGGEIRLGTLKARLEFLSGLASFPSGTCTIFVVPNSTGVQAGPTCLLFTALVLRDLQQLSPKQGHCSYLPGQGW